MTKPDLMAELAEFARLDAVAIDKSYYEGIDAREGRDEFAVNFLRTHHAELEAVVRDKQRLDFLQREVDQIGAYLLHNGQGSGKGFTGLGLKNTGRTLRQAIDQCLGADAMHNSAREGL